MFTDRQNIDVPKIAIIGAGLAGLTAAYRLEQMNCHYDLYEAKERVGGRVFTVKLHEKVVELGGANLRDGGEAKNIRALINEMGLETFSYFQEMNPTLIEKDKSYCLTALLKEQAFHPENLDKKLNELASTSQNMQEVIDRLISPQNPLNLFSQKVISSYEGAEPKKISPFCFQTLYHFLLGGLSAVHPKKSDSYEEGSIQFEEIKGGNYSLVDKLVKKVQHRLHLKCPLEVLSVNEQGRYILEFKGGVRREADYVILTVPTTVLKNIKVSESILSKERKKQMETTLYGNPAKIFFDRGNHDIEPQFVYHEKFFFRYKEPSDSFCLFFFDPHGDFDQNTIQDKYDQSIKQLHYLDQFLFTQEVRYAEEVPLKNYNCSVGYSWQNDPYIRGSYSSTPIGYDFGEQEIVCIEGESILPLYAPVQKSLFFAGEHTTADQNISGTMEAAVESAEKTIRILKQMMITKPKKVNL